MVSESPQNAALEESKVIGTVDDDSLEFEVAECIANEIDKQLQSEPKSVSSFALQSKQRQAKV